MRTPGSFQFKQFTVIQDRSALKVGTDAVLLGAAMTLTDTAQDILDIGTGTGVIALMAAQRLGKRNFSIKAIDIDPLSVEDARDNFAASPWADRLKAERISMQDFASACGSFDLIFSNPPFYDNSLKNPSLRESAARHTTSLSWRDIISFAAEHLRRPEDIAYDESNQSCKPGGTLSMILPAEEETRLLRTAASFGLFPFRLIRISTVSSKPPRRLIAEFSFTGTTNVREERLTLNDGTGRSAEYAGLTEEFYL